MDINKIWGLFSGRKTYIVAALLAIATFALNVGWIDQETFNTIQTLLLAAGLGTIRAAITAGAGK